MRNFIFRATLLLASAIGGTATAAVITKDVSNADALDQPSSWIGGVVPGPNDIAYFPPQSGGTYTLGVQQWRGVHSESTAHQTFNSGTLELGSAGMISTGNIYFTWSSSTMISLACPQVWDIRSGILTPPSVNLNGHNLTLAGGGTKQAKGSFLGTGVITVLEGPGLELYGGTHASEADVRMYAGCNFYINLGVPSAGTPRAKNLFLLPGSAQLTGDSNRWENDVIAEMFAIGQGHSQISINTHNAVNKRLTAPVFERAVGATLLARGINLGVIPLDSTEASFKTSHLAFDTVPPLAGGAGAPGSTTQSIWPFMVGNTNITDVGTMFATYDATYGVRLLLADEYADALTDGQNTLDNVRLVNADDAPRAIVLTQPTTVNSLMLVSSTLSSGFEITGGSTLTLASGALHNLHMTSAGGTHNDARAIIAPAFLDLNENEGIFYFSLTATNKGLEGAPLTFATCITNDAGKGVTFVGLNNRTARLASPLHGYTGPTRVNAGVLWLNSPVPNSAVPGDLVVNGGTLLNPGNQIPDTSDVHINAGIYAQRENLSDYGSNETFRDLYMTGGTFQDGTSFGNFANTYVRNAFLAGGVWEIPTKRRSTTSGQVVFSGGRVTLSGSNDAPGFTPGAIWVAGGDIIITNTPTARAYAPISIGSSAYRQMIGYMSLLGDFYFVGNNVNDNPATVASSGASIPGAMCLAGLRTFNIGDGAAADDVAIQLEMADLDSNTPGGFVKTGLGTLLLSAPTNSFTLASEVRAGTLAVRGQIKAPLNIATSATLHPRGFRLENNLALANGAKMIFDLSKAAPDFMAVTGTITGAGTTEVTLVPPDLLSLPPEERITNYLLATAVDITGDFSTAGAKGWRVYKTKNNTQLRAGKITNTLLLLK